MEIGIALGCTISSILFAMAMEVILKAAEGSAGPANLSGGCYMPPLKAFMDNTTAIYSNESKTRQKIECLNGLTSWCSLNSKPKKFSSLTVISGKTDAAITFTIANKQILMVSEEPVKSLGRQYNSFMKDTKRG